MATSLCTLEPDWGFDREDLPKEEHYVIAWVEPNPIEVENAKGQFEFSYPYFSYKHKCIIENEPEKHSVSQLQVVFRRIRNYLTFQFGIKVPLKARFIGKHLLTQFNFKGDHCVFRSKVATRFGLKWPPNSEQNGHLFRSESGRFLAAAETGGRHVPK